MTKSPKLTKPQQQVLDVINAGVVAIYAPYRTGGVAYWWFRGYSGQNIKQVEKLVELGLVQATVTTRGRKATALPQNEEA